MAESSINTRTTAENGLVAVNNGDQSSTPTHLNLLELSLHYGGDLLKGGKDSMLQPLKVANLFLASSPL